MKTIACPFCGGGMMPGEYENPVQKNIRHTAFKCRQCGAKAPGGRDWAEAEKKAEMRYRDRKPMTAIGARWYTGMAVIEYLSYHDIPKMGIVSLSDTEMLEYDTLNTLYKSEMKWENYGKKWRLWREIPTREERDAAAWEETT